MKTVGVPFCITGKETIKERDELKKELEKAARKKSETGG